MPRRQLETYGGTNTATVYSGGPFPVSLLGIPGGVAAGGDVLLYSGAGRLDGGFVHLNVTSGLPVTFYDGAAAVSGGPLASSGHILLGMLEPGAALFSGFGNFDRGGLIQIGTTFGSGLCAHVPSGAPGFTVSWTPLP